MAEGREEEGDGPLGRFSPHSTSGHFEARATQEPEHMSEIAQS